MPEAPLEGTDAGVIPSGEGWFESDGSGFWRPFDEQAREHASRSLLPGD